MEAAVATVRRAHEGCRRAIRTRASLRCQRAGARRVGSQCALTDSFLAAYQAYGPDALTPDEADRFVGEQAQIGRLLDADPVPTYC